MKEASGELSMTAVAVVAIAAVGVLFTTLIWPNIKNSILNSQRCSSAFACNCSGKTCNCLYYPNENSTDTANVVCSNSNMKS